MLNLFKNVVVVIIMTKKFIFVMSLYLVLVIVLAWFASKRDSYELWVMTGLFAGFLIKNIEIHYLMKKKEVGR